MPSLTSIQKFFDYEDFRRGHQPATACVEFRVHTLAGVAAIPRDEPFQEEIAQRILYVI